MTQELTGQIDEAEAAANETALATGDGARVVAAIKQLRSRALTYRKCCDYYDGKQPLTYASDKYDEQFAKMVAAYTENMCPTVVDALCDRLIITGFDSATDDEGVNMAQATWELQRMDQRALEVHQEAVKCGDAYVIVWNDPLLPSDVRFWVQEAAQCTVHYDEDENIDWAAKWWLEGNIGRLTIYGPLTIERWRTARPLASGAGMPTRAESYVLEQVLPNMTGVVPVFHFANAAPIGRFGRSELHDVFPIQDALNKATADMLVGMEFAAWPQRWATGLQNKLDVAGKPMAPFVAGADRLWSTTNPEGRFGQFDAMELPNVIAAQNKFLTAVARVTGTPTHYMLLEGADFPSGEALKTAEARFIAKIEHRQTAFGNSWEDVMRFALRLQGHEQPPDQHLSVVWQDASPRSEREAAEVAILKSQVGVSNQQLQSEMGYSDEEIEKMEGEKAEAADAAMERQQASFDRGAPPAPRPGRNNGNGGGTPR